VKQQGTLAQEQQGLQTHDQHEVQQQGLLALEQQGHPQDQHEVQQQQQQWGKAVGYTDTGTTETPSTGPTWGAAAAGLAQEQQGHLAKTQHEVQQQGQLALVQQGNLPQDQHEVQQQGYWHRNNSDTHSSTWGAATAGATGTWTTGSIGGAAAAVRWSSRAHWHRNNREI
jgi:hypothetical protein